MARYTRHSIGEVEVLGETLKVEVTSDGTFYLKQGDRGIGSGDTLAKAKQKAREYLNKTRVEVAVPFLSPNGSRGVGLRRHPKTRNIHVRWDETGGADEYAYGVAREMFRPDAPIEKIKRLQEIREVVHKLGVERREIEKAYGFDLGSAVDRAVEAEAEEIISTEGIEGVG